jgi:tetratricopeptide (TPR) repeat protein
VSPPTALRARRAAVGAAAAACLAGAVALHAAEDRWPAPSVDRPELLYLRSPAVARRLVLDYEAIAADLYWIRALQHFGQERLSPPEHVRSYALLYPLLDLTTTLDPYFSIAYRFGAIYLGEAYPGGPGRPDLAVALLQKGLAAQPTKWQYMMDLGFVYYWHLRDYKSAAAAFQRASAVRGAPTWLRPLAAVTLAEGGHRDASRALWQQLVQADEPWLRDSARLRLAQLDAMDVIESLQAPVQAVRAAHPGEPVTWERLVAARLLPGIPLDSSATPFALDPVTGAITVARESKLFPLPGQLQAPR